MRHLFISDIVKELLGPRYGAEENLLLTDDPRNEYTTGQLIPPMSSCERNPDDEDSLAANASAGEEDSDDRPISFMNQAFIDSGQNFRRIPSSMGISFALSTEPNDGDINICVTWARYEFDPEKGWIRIPHYWICSYSKAALANGEKAPDDSLSITYKVTKLKTGICKISIYLSSAIVSQPYTRPKSDKIIFQPELRLLLHNSNALIELGDLSFVSEDSEWRISTRQYDQLKVYARGHLCGAYWWEIDPQRPFEHEISPRPQIPFEWVDGIHFLQKDDRIKSFFQPHLRTDFIPIYPSPKMDSASEIKFQADLIAECSTYDQLHEILEPVVKEYEKWMKNLKVGLSTSDVDKKIIERHRQAISRIRKGLSFLREDREAFLSFLFMNKVMAKQYGWGKKDSDKIMYWRLFQIAFILLTIESSVKENDDRKICDTIWFPTGGGKTEAYLGLAAFVLAYRRRVSPSDSDGSKSGEGTCVISRYTLRLLTIQQYRRALKMIMACEILRCISDDSESQGWLPSGVVRPKGFIWGRSPFSIGLWVGASVTPNAMRGDGYKDFAPGAIHALENYPQSDESDPAQVIECPCCRSLLSFPIDGIPAEDRKLWLIVLKRPSINEQTRVSISTPKIRINSIKYFPHNSRKCGYIGIDVTFSTQIKATDIIQWWTNIAEPALETSIISFNAARPGYIPIEGGRRGTISDYEIRCPNPLCEINTVIFKYKLPSRTGNWEFAKAHSLFASDTDPCMTIGDRITAITVDEKLYENPPSLLIATVDKLARMAFLNEAAALFGRVRSFCDNKGFSQDQPNSRKKIPIPNFLPPWLIIQDELHLLEGPLGSTFGLFETAIEVLCNRPKYIASSATIRNSTEQVNCLMGRNSNVFPPVSMNVEDGFFLRSMETHPLDDHDPGRLFMGLAFPGRAPQTPMLRVWGRLLQTAQNQLEVSNKIDDAGARKEHLRCLDYFWTLIGYFNAVRELAQGEALTRQDIPQYLDKLQRQNPGTIKRELNMEGFRNLSSQTGSSELPGILAKMERSLLAEGGDVINTDVLNAVASTSMFGTGVDIARLSLMVVHGQPKSASQYIQAVGRIGRQKSGLAVVFFRVSKPRDLNHYEYFTGYHRKLPIAVEPISVKPLAPKAMDRTLGALLAILIRNWRETDPNVPDGIDLNENGGLIIDMQPLMLERLLKIFEEKCDQQPLRRRPRKESFIQYIRSQVERWRDFSRRQSENGELLPYTQKRGMVVLGDADSISSVFSNVPQSLREVEPMINLNIEND